MKKHIKIIIGILIILVLSLGVTGFLSRFHFDLSQDYRNIDGYEGIVFKDSGSDQYFRLCSWGLVITKSPDVFEDHRETIGMPYDEYESFVESINARECDIWQVVPSPDGKYILYAEKIYSGSGVTDDEDVYYKVYSIEDGTTVTIYSGYRQYLVVDWK